MLYGLVGALKKTDSQFTFLFFAKLLQRANAVFIEVFTAAADGGLSCCSSPNEILSRY